MTDPSISYQLTTFGFLLATVGLVLSIRAATTCEFVARHEVHGLELSTVEPITQDVYFNLGLFRWDHMGEIGVVTLPYESHDCVSYRVTGLRSSEGSFAMFAVPDTDQDGPIKAARAFAILSPICGLVTFLVSLVLTVQTCRDRKPSWRLVAGSVLTASLAVVAQALTLILMFQSALCTQVEGRENGADWREIYSADCVLSQGSKSSITGLALWILYVMALLLWLFMFGEKEEREVRNSAVDEQHKEEAPSEQAP